jgi:DHA3 family macrolide efflux protein-like MFS transporter
MSVQFALIWWLTRTTGSATILATASFLGLLPLTLLGPFIGAWVDRFDRKRIMLAADSAVAAVSLLLAALFFLDLASVGVVLAILFVRAVGGAFHAPAMLASTSLMVPERHLTRIQGLNQMLQGGQMIVTAPLGAVLIALLPMGAVMLVDVVTAVFAIAPLLFIHVPRPQRSEAEPGSTRSTWADVRAGLRYLWQRGGHLALLAMAAVVNLCMVPAFSLLPLLVVEQGGGAMELAWMSSLLGAGTIAGGILLGIWGGFKVRIYTSFAALLAIGLATLALGAAPTWGWALVAIAAVGMTVPLVNGPIQAVLQATVAPEFQGRVFTLYGSLASIAAPVGLAMAAPIAELLGVRVWYAAGGVACLLMGIGGFLIPAIARMERQSEAIA